MDPNLTMLYGPTASAGITVAAVQIAKSLGLSTRWAPVAALVSGVGWNMLIGWGILHRPALETVAAGIIAGMVASGVYSQVRALARKPIV